MFVYARSLDLDLRGRSSAFLWGPRKTGKSFYLRQRFPRSTTFDFLKSDLFFEVAKRPALVRERLLALADEGRLVEPIILDEVQKVPALLDEVHWLIENRGWQFILCGSSPRKLRRGHANLLGGRAWRFQLHPLTVREIPDFDLLAALNRGLIPAHYAETRHCQRSLKAYVNDYLQEEIMAEGLSRNLAAFARFLDSIAFSHGQMVSFAGVARDCGIDAKTVKAYYQILVDTMLGVFVEPFVPRAGRDIISSTPKFYLFDVGVAGWLMRRQVATERGETFGRAFEHFILMELLAYRSYAEKDFPVNYWRTRHGVEVDFVLGGGKVAIEVKGGRNLDRAAFRPLRVFAEEHRPARAILVANEPEPRRVEGVEVLPWRHFLAQLWDGKLGLT